MKVHTMKLTDGNFRGIADGSKTYEIRLLDGKRRAIEVDDEIIFSKVDDETSQILVRVVSLQTAPSFLDLFSGIDVSRAGWPSGTSPGKAAADMSKYYRAEEQVGLGTLAIEIEKA